MARPKAKVRISKISKSEWAAVCLFAMDVDGILTDGVVTIHSDGTESKAFSIIDGLGLVRCREAGITLAWISGRSSGSSSARAAELKIPHLIQGRTDKRTALKELATYLNLSPAQVCYMGDDDIDAPALEWAGIGVTVPTAMPAPLSVSRYVTRRAAGLGAVREVCEHLLAARGLTFPHDI